MVCESSYSQFVPFYPFKQENYWPDSFIQCNAHYNGKTTSDSKRILDNSQNQRAHGHKCMGHPRGHALNLSQIKKRNSIHTYSHGKTKCGFQSPNDQDIIAHYALISEDARLKMQELNENTKGKDRKLTAKVTISAETLKSNGTLSSLPKMVKYKNGKQISQPEDFDSVVMILRHHRNQQNNPDAPVFVQTLYPKAQSA